MKVLKVILIAAISIILIAVVVGYLQPRKIELQVSDVIQAPTCVVFDNVNDLTKRTNWSPWEQMDTTIVTTMGDITSGKGASYTWTSENSGDGKLTYIDYEENKLLKSELDFGQEQPAFATFTFNEVEDGVEVIWSFEADMGGAFYQRLFGVMMKSILEQTYTNGLANLSAQAKADADNPCLSAGNDVALGSVSDNATILKNGEGIGKAGEIVEIEITEVPFIGIIDSCEAISEQMGALIGGGFGKIMSYMQSTEAQMTNAPIVFYHKWEPPTKVVMEPAAVASTNGAELPEGLLSGTINSGKVIMSTHMGAYETSEETWMAVQKYVEDNGMEINGSPWEEYITDPTTEPDTSLWETRIYFPVKN